MLPDHQRIEKSPGLSRSHASRRYRFNAGTRAREGAPPRPGRPGLRGTYAGASRFKGTAISAELLNLPDGPQGGGIRGAGGKEGVVEQGKGMRAEDALIRPCRSLRWPRTARRATWRWRQGVLDRGLVPSRSRPTPHRPLARNGFGPVAGESGLPDGGLVVGLGGHSLCRSPALLDLRAMKCFVRQHGNVQPGLAYVRRPVGVILMGPQKFTA